MLPLLTLLLCLSYSNPINYHLPPLVNHSYTLPSEILQVNNKEIFKYQIEGDNYPQVSINDSLGNTIHSCMVLPSFITASTLDQYRMPSGANNRASFHTIKYQSLIYTLTQNYTLTAYSFNETAINKLGSLQLQGNTNTFEDKHIVFVSTSDQKYLFLFSTSGVWRIRTGAVLAQVEKVELEVRTLVYSAVSVGNRLFLAAENYGIAVYDVSSGGGLVLISSWDKFMSASIHPVDLRVDVKTNLLFALDYYQNIYIYRLSDDFVQYYDIIEVKHQAQYKLRTSGSRVFYSFAEDGMPQIAELSYSPSTKQASLIRYYKHFNDINDFLILGDELHLLEGEALEIFPTNVDPRTIVTEYNAKSVPMKGHRIEPVALDTFVLLGKETLSLVRLERTPNTLFCNLTAHREFVQITYSTNVTSCGEYNPSLERTSFNQFCEVSREISININIPEELEREKVLIYAVVVGVVLVFVASLICLIQWRNGRLDIIDEITEEIVYFQNRNKRLEPYTDNVEFEVHRRTFNNDSLDQPKQSKESDY